jgi:class 3 adenylate cyclase/tetratricopeptide (TPR) repeat protein
VACGALPPPGARFCSDCGRALAGAPTPAPAPASYTPRHISEQILAVRSAIEGERKQVTVLFCDIVKSSDLASRLGPEDFHQVVDRFFQGALAEVHRYEGTINQFLGDGFMALFGAPIAHEDHARRAVLAALGIGARTEVQIRIGINSGLVVVGTIGDDLRVDYTAFGDTTVLAARLQAAAEPGAVLVSQRTARLVRRYFQLEEVPPVRVKERTVHPLRVTGPVTRTASVADDLSPFTGRDIELAELGRALDEAADGEGQVVGLVGDPGLGKSRLAWEFRRLAESRAGVLVGRCLSYGAGIPYLPLFEVVRQACGISADDGAEVVAARIELRIKALELDISLAQYLQHAFGLKAGDPALAQLDAEVIRARTFWALRRLLMAEAGQRPLVVLIEDLHWIDQTSQDFLAEFTNDLQSIAVLLLVTYRPGYSPPWIGKSFASQLALRPLTRSASKRIVASILGSDLAETTAIATRGEGNPFFLEELARAARDQSGGEADAGVPETVQQVLAARIDRLSADQKAAIQLAAVLGREFSLDLAEQVWDGAVPLEAQMQELKGLEFLRERPGPAERTFMFKHALTRDVAYDGMLEAHRRDLHGRVGAILENTHADQRFEHSELLGYHYSRSAQPERAIPHLAVAGDRAKERYANEEAIARYREAISLVEALGDTGNLDQYSDICESLGKVLVRLSRYDEAVEAYGKGLVMAADPFRRAHLHVLRSEADNGAHRYREALAQCDLAEQALGSPSDEPEWMSSWFTIQEQRMGVLYWLNDQEGYARLIERIRPFVEEHGSAEQRKSFYLSLAGLSLRRDRYSAADETVEFARAGYAGTQEADPSLLGWSAFNLGFTLLWHGDLEEATEMLRGTLAEAEQSGDAALRSRSLTYLMVAARMRGDVAEVREAIGPVIEQAREASFPEYEAMAIANRAWVAWRSGEMDQAAADAQAALALWRGLPIRYWFDWMALWPLAAMALDSGRVDEAIDHAHGMLIPPQQPLQEAVQTRVEAAVQASDQGAEAAELLRLAIEAAREHGYL